MDFLLETLNKSQSLTRLLEFQGTLTFPHEKQSVDSRRLKDYVQKWVALLSSQTISGPIFLSLPTGFDFTAALFACFQCGIPVAPVQSRDSTTEKEFFKNIEKLKVKSSIRNIIVSSEYKNSFPNMKTFTPNDLSSTKLELDKSSIDEVAIIQFSSGSTNDPKGIMLSHRQVLTNLRQIDEGLGKNKQRKILSWLPMYHDMGLIGGLLGCMSIGQGGVFLRPIDFVSAPKKFLQMIAEEKINMLVGPDFMYRLLVKAKKQMSEALDFSNVHICLTGAEPVQLQTCLDFQEAFKDWRIDSNAITPVYGMAEVGLAVSFHTINTPLKPSRGFLSCGQPLSGVKLKIVDEEGNEVPLGSIGEIYLQSPSFCSGFYGDNDLYQQIRSTGWLQTGDLGFIENQEVFVTGRIKDIIIRNGQKYFPSDLEERLFQTSPSHVSRVIVVAKDEGIAVVCEIKFKNWKLRPKLTDGFCEELKSICPVNKENIFFVPKRSMPRTSSGKIQRYKVKENVGNGVYKNSLVTFIKLRLSSYGIG